MRLDDWQRIEKIVRWTGLSVNSFALNIGLSRGENLYQIKKGNHGISKELAELISAKYPEVSRSWVLTGDGEMLISESFHRNMIPCYDADAIYLTSLESLPQPSYFISLPRACGATFGALNLGKAMEPDIPSGATVILVTTDEQKIVPGLQYLVVTDRFSILRTVKREAGDDLLRLVASNPNYDDMVIDVCEIKKLYLVKGYIYLNP